jgi:hypothetical protein
MKGFQHKMLTKEKIIEVMRKLAKQAEKDSVEYALIGGALFKMLDFPVETEDVDVAAADYIDLPFHATKEQLKKSGNPWDSCDLITTGHHLVEDVHVDWMPRGKPGSDDLFKAAVKSAFSCADGIWLANPEFAAAIKLYAGRPQDKETLDLLWDQGLINLNLVHDILRQYTTWSGQ